MSQWQSRRRYCKSRDADFGEDEGVTWVSFRRPTCLEPAREATRLVSRYKDSFMRLLLLFAARACVRAMAFLTNVAKEK